MELYGQIENSIEGIEVNVENISGEMKDNNEASQMDVVLALDLQVC